VKIRCPQCGKAIDLNAVSMNTVVRDILMIYQDLDRDAARQVREYMDLFRSPGGQLADRKHLRLLQELVGWMRAGRIEYYGKPYPLAASDILAGVATVCNQEPSTLRNHNYLRKILVSICERREKISEDREEIDRMHQRNRAAVGAARPEVGGERMDDGAVRELISRALPGFGRRHG